MGGNNALSLQEYTAYGLRATTGVNRNEVEGIRVGGANGSNDNYLSDFASFSEIAITAVGRAAAMPVPEHSGPVRQQVGRQRISPEIYARIFRTTRLKPPTSTTAKSGAASQAGPASTRARCQPAAALSGDFTADVGGYLKEDRAMVVRAYCRSRRSSSNTPGTLGLRPRGSKRWSCQARSPTCCLAARNSSDTSSTKPSSNRVFSPSARASPHCVQRCTPARGVSGERVEGRVQRCPDGRDLRRGTHRRLSAPTPSAHPRAPTRALPTLVRIRSAVAPCLRSD